LPAEIIERIFSLIPGRSLGWISLTCTRNYNIANTASLWTKIIENENLVISDHIDSYAQNLLQHIQQAKERDPESRLELPVLPKLWYILAKKVRLNIGRNNYKEGLIPHFSPENAVVGISDDYMVSIEKDKLRSWRLKGKWIELTGYTTIDVSPSQYVYQVLVAKNIGIICWSFNELGGPGENDQRNCQSLQAFDTEDNCNFLWERKRLLGTKHQFISCQNDKIVMIDKIREIIEILRPEKEGLISEIKLEQPRHYMRMLNSTFTLTNKYFVLGGTLVPENVPVVSCWRIACGSRQILTSNRPVCPFRSFKKTAVRGDSVFGLLNRFRLFCWDANTAQVRYSVDLSTASPGDDEASAAWLSLDQELVLTVHQNESYVTVLSQDGIHLGSIRQMPLQLEDESSMVKSCVEQVIVRGYTAVLRLVSETLDQSVCEIVTADLTPFIDTLERRRNGENPISLIAYVSITHNVDPIDQHGAGACYTVFNSTKIVDIQTLGIKFYDFLFTGNRFPDREPCQH